GAGAARVPRPVADDERPRARVRALLLPQLAPGRGADPRERRRARHGARGAAADRVVDREPGRGGCVLPVLAHARRGAARQNPRGQTVSQNSTVLKSLIEETFGK